ncbi:MAG: CD1871A family CXXC motif-containing protein [Bacillota bacterium]
MGQKWNRYIVLALALGVFAYGIARGEHVEVLDKAVTLCLECLGLR